MGKEEGGSRMNARIICATLAFATLLLSAAPPVEAAWIPDGIAVCQAIGEQSYPVIASDGAGGAIIAWHDARGANEQIFAQRIGAQGDPLWAADGVPIGASGNSGIEQQIMEDGAGGAIIAWCRVRSTNPDSLWYDTQVRVQRIDADGTPLWPAGGRAVCSTGSSQALPRLAPDGSGGTIVVWRDVSGDIERIYAQRVSSDGSLLWGSNGVCVCSDAGIGGTTHHQVTSDGSEGAIIVWDDARDGSSRIYAQRIEASGSAMWTIDGICLTPTSSAEARLVPDGIGGAVIAWQDYRADNPKIFVQRIDANGIPAWASGGIQVCTAESDQWTPRIASVGAGGAIVGWSDLRGSLWDLYAQRISPSGAVLWNAEGIPVCAAPGSQYEMEMISDGAGGAIFAWGDPRDNPEPLSPEKISIYAQRIDGSGLPLWIPDGMLLCGASNYREEPDLVSNGQGGAIVAWMDGRAVSNNDIYAQAIDIAGNTIVATLLRNYSAAFAGTVIEIAWELSQLDDGAEFKVSRGLEEAGPFEEIASPRISRAGLSYSCLDGAFEAGETYWYRVALRVGADEVELFKTGPIATPAMPLTLYQNAPNPFNPSTTITAFLPERCFVDLAIYDATGRLVKRLGEGHREKGAWTVTWNGRNSDESPASSGIYFCRLDAGSFSRTIKMVLLR
jgi:hypothetical protein